MRKTKIICTLGPATKDDEVLKQLMEWTWRELTFPTAHRQNIK